MLEQSLLAVLGAGRGEPAGGGQQGRDENLIPTDGKNQKEGDCVHNPAEDAPLLPHTLTILGGLKRPFAHHGGDAG